MMGLLMLSNEIDRWNRFARACMDCGDNAEIQKMPEKFGKEKNDYLVASYQARDTMTDDDFMREHGISAKRLDAVKQTIGTRSVPYQ